MAAGMVRSGQKASEHQIIRRDKIIKFSAATTQPIVRGAGSIYYYCPTHKRKGEW